MKVYICVTKRATIPLAPCRLSKWAENGLVIFSTILQTAQLSPPSPLPPPLEFCIDEDNSVIRSAMHALRNKKNTLLTVTVLFLFAFFNLILDAPRILKSLMLFWLKNAAGTVEYFNFFVMAYSKE
jgi:hypothetical protein